MTGRRRAAPSIYPEYQASSSRMEPGAGRTPDTPASYPARQSSGCSVTWPAIGLPGTFIYPRRGELVPPRAHEQGRRDKDRRPVLAHARGPRESE